MKVLEEKEEIQLILKQFNPINHEIQQKIHSITQERREKQTKFNKTKNNRTIRFWQIIALAIKGKKKINRRNYKLLWVLRQWKQEDLSKGRLMIKMELKLMCHKKDQFSEHLRNSMEKIDIWNLRRDQ